MSYVEPYSHVTVDITEDYAKNNAEFGSFELNDKYIQLPCRASLILDLGFAPEEDEKIPRKSVADWVNVYDSQGRELTLAMYNDSNKSVGPEDCIVYKVRHEFSENEGLDFSVMGVGSDTNPDSIEIILGKPSNYYSHSDIDNADWRSSKRERYVSFGWDEDNILEAVTYVYPPEEVNDFRYSDETAPYWIILVAGIALSIYGFWKRKRKILDTPIEELEDSILEKYDK